MSRDSLTHAFQTLRAQYFDPLCDSLGLRPGPSEIELAFGWVSAQVDHVRVFFEYERSLCQFSLGSALETKPLCAVETIAKRFPRIRLLPDGDQRLSLDEQRTFLETNWAALQILFSPEHLPETRHWNGIAALEAGKDLGGSK